MSATSIVIILVSAVAIILALSALRGARRGESRSGDGGGYIAVDGGSSAKSKNDSNNDGYDGGSGGDGGGGGD